MNIIGQRSWWKTNSCLEVQDIYPKINKSIQRSSPLNRILIKVTSYFFKNEFVITLPKHA